MPDVYVTVSDGEFFRSRVVRTGVIVELDDEDHVIGVEIRNAQSVMVDADRPARITVDIPYGAME